MQKEVWNRAEIHLNVSRAHNQELQRPVRQNQRNAERRARRDEIKKERMKQRKNRKKEDPYSSSFFNFSFAKIFLIFSFFLFA
jgi:hypothetical protein